MKQILQEEARRTYAFEMDESQIEAAEDALYHTLQSGYEETDGGVSNVETVSI